MLADEELGHRIYTLTSRSSPAIRCGSASRCVTSRVASATAESSLRWSRTAPTSRIGLAARHRLSAESRAQRAPETARAHGLAPRPPFPSLDDVEARRTASGGERIAFEAVVGTDEDQIAVAPGTLRRTWTEGGRRYFHYATDAPIANEYSFFSAEYAS